MSDPVKTPVTPEDAFGPAVPDPDGTARGRPSHQIRRERNELLQRLRALGSPADRPKHRVNPGAGDDGNPGPSGEHAAPTSAPHAPLPSPRDTLRSLPDLAAERTSRLDRIDRGDLDTPAPLPPAPLADGQDGWFESVPTNPAPSADLAALAMHGGSVITGMTPVGFAADAESTRSLKKQRPNARSQPTWVLPVLLSATSLAVGMVLGALIFGSRPQAALGAGDDCQVDAAQSPLGGAAASGAQATDCTLAVSSAPDGATVSIDGREVGTTPVEASGLPCGAPVAVELRKSHWRIARRTARATAGEATRLDVDLERPLAKLTVRTSPPGARVSVLGENVGRSPVTVSVPAWTEVPVSATLPGYAPGRERVTPKGKTARVRMNLRKR